MRTSLKMARPFGLPLVMATGLLALTLAAGCVGDPNKPDTWIKKLRDPRSQKEAISQLVRINDPVAVPALIDWYNDPKSNQSPEVFDAILHFHDSRAVPLLIKTLDFSEQTADSATKAAEELGRLKAKEAVPALVAALEKPLAVTSRANLVKHAAIRALAKIGDKQVVEPLCKVVRALPSDQDLFLNKVAILALGELGDGRAVPCVLEAAFISRADGANVFQEVRQVIAKLRGSASGPLIELLKEKNAAVQALGKKLDFERGVVGFKAAYLIGDARLSAAVPTLLSRLREPPAGNMQRAILVALGQIGDAQGLEAAVGVLKDGKAPLEMRQTACEALVAGRYTKGLPTLVGVAKDAKAKDMLRLAAGMAAGRLGGKAELAELEGLAKQGDAWKQVVERLELGAKCQQGGDACYIDALSSPESSKHPVAQEKAAFMLGMSANPAPALEALSKQIGASEPVVRLAIIDSLRRLAKGPCAPCASRIKEQIVRDEKVARLPGMNILLSEMKVAQAFLE